MIGLILCLWATQFDQLQHQRILPHDLMITSNAITLQKKSILIHVILFRIYTTCFIEYYIVDDEHLGSWAN